MLQAIIMTRSGANVAWRRFEVRLVHHNSPTGVGLHVIKLPGSDYYDFDVRMYRCAEHRLERHGYKEIGTRLQRVP
jgi:hypothetical protein